MPGMSFDPSGDTSGETVAAARLVDGKIAEQDGDQALARRSRSGDMNAYGQLVARYEKKIHALVARILGMGATREDIDDTVQEIFIQAWRAMPGFRGDARFSTWLYRIATNMAIKQWHRGKKQRHIVAQEDLPEPIRLNIVDPGPSPGDRIERQARDKALYAAIEALPEKQRTVLLLHYFENYSCDEVAEMIGCSVGTVWSRLHYACRKLRGSLDWMTQS